MKITVLNGSPKGEQSVTMQYVTFMQKKYPSYSYKIINISQRIKRIEKDEKAFLEIIEEINNANAILWATPVYFFLVPYQLKRFIELVSEKNAAAAFKNKYTAIITTSIHFYDHTAHNYMRAICEDLNMKYVDYFSAHMYDLAKEKGRSQLIDFAENFFNTIEKKIAVSTHFMPLLKSNFKYWQESIVKQISARGKKVLLLSDNSNQQSNVSKMLAQFKANFIEEPEEINISKLDIKGGCIGCIQCGYDNTCRYEGKDDYIEFYNSKVKTADIIVFAGEIKDRFLSAYWKLFLDRSFFNNHSPTLTNKQIIYIISGPLSQVSDIRQIFDANTQIQRANLVEFISDEYADSSIINKIITTTAQKAIDYSMQNIKREMNYLGVGGMKIFRDDIYGPLRFPFVADYKTYKKLGIFDSLQNGFRERLKTMLMYTLVRFSKIRDHIYKKELKSGMIKPLQKINDRIVVN